MEGGDGFLERVAADEPHRVVGPAIAVVPEPVDRDDAGVLQAAGDLGLDQEPGPAHRVVGVVVENPLERDLAVELAVERHEDNSQSALSMLPEHAKSLPIAGRWAEGHGG